MTLVVVPDREAVAEHAATLFFDAAAAGLADNDHFVVALSGGSTPRRFHERLVERYRDKIDWARLEIFFSDERAVPLDDPSSNFRMAKETLFDPLSETGLCIHVPRTNATNLDDAAAAYADALSTATHGTGAADLVFLGMGADGHTASLFPGFGEPPGLVAAVDAPTDTAAARRLTFTYEALIRARHVVVLVAGEGKAAMLREVLVDGSDRPIGRILARRHARQVLTTIIADEPAAAQTQESSHDG